MSARESLYDSEGGSGGTSWLCYRASRYSLVLSGLMSGITVMCVACRVAYQGRLGTSHNSALFAVPSCISFIESKMALRHKNPSGQIRGEQVKEVSVL